MIRGILYEHKVDKLHVGMMKSEVEDLYGTGIKLGGSQFYYELEGNLWYSNLEDSYRIHYINNIVNDFERVGL